MPSNLPPSPLRCSAALLGLLLAGCNANTSSIAPAGNSESPSFRVRAASSAPLNADTGWAGGTNETATVAADRPFRVRFEWQEPTPAAQPTRAVRLQYRRNGGEWSLAEAHDFPHPESARPRTPRLSIVSTTDYAPGSATAALLAGSGAGFAPGSGANLEESLAVRLTAGQRTEFEWPVVIRRFADDAVTNEEGDRFDLRLVDADNPDRTHSALASVRLTIPPGHLGGTFVETPGRIGPWAASNGDLYFIMEPAETSNLFMMVKSSDRGRTWREVDGGNRPRTRDLESVDTRLLGPTLHILHQVTSSTRYHTFRTSDHPTDPDTWAIRDETAATTRSIAQATSLAVRSDGSIVAFFVGPSLQFAVRDAQGAWGPTADVPPVTAAPLAGPQAVLGADDTVHVAYYAADGTLWHRRLPKNGMLSEATRLAEGAGTTRADYGAVLPLVYLPEADTVAILYRLGDGHLWERRLAGNLPPSAPVRVSDREVIRHAVDSQQPAADVVAWGGTLHVLFVDAATRSVRYTHDGGGWQPSTLEVDGILGSWVRGQVHRRADGVPVYGYVYDAGSDGGAGMNRYRERVLETRP